MMFMKKKEYVLWPTMCFEGEIGSQEIKPDAVRTKWHQEF